MKFLHTSDWHLGRSESVQSLADDQRFFIDEICKIAKEEDVDAVLLAGDVYDRQIAPAEAIRLYDEAMTRLCIDLRKKVLVIAGNHDSAERLSSCANLLKGAGLYIAGALQREVEKVEFPDTDVYLLPWISEEKVKSIFPEKADGINSIEEAYRVVLDAVRENWDPKKKHVVLAHAFITKAETSLSDRAAEIGNALQVSQSVFDGFDYAALGHIHKPQAISARVRYSGTPMPYAFGKEETQEKSVTIVDTADFTAKTVALPLLHQRKTIEGTYDELLSAPCTEKERTGYVRLVVKDAYMSNELFGRLRAIYPNLLEAQGKNADFSGGSATITIDDYRKIENDPVSVLKAFCRDVIGEEASAHIQELFLKAAAETEKQDEAD